MSGILEWVIVAYGFFSFSRKCDCARDDFVQRLYHPASPLGEKQVCEVEQQKSGI